MSNDKNYSEQFERYLKGQMSPQEAHAFERDILNDPFSQEALEGFEVHGLSALHDLELLKAKVSSSEKKAFPFMKIAAAIALLLVASFTVYFFTTQVSEDQLAMEEEPMEEIGQSNPTPDTVPLPTVQETDATESISDKPIQSGASKKDEPRAIDEIEIGNQLARADEELGNTEAVVDELVLAEAVEAPMELEVEVTDLLQGRAAGVQITERSEPKPILLDTSELEEVVVAAQPLVAKKESLSNSAPEIKEPTKQKTAVARSRSTSNDIVSGMVTDDSGDPLPGVNVVIKGTTTGVTTDFDGSYQLSKTDDMILIYSFVGFESQQIEVGNRTTVDVMMGGAMELQEVVVTGYDAEDVNKIDSYTPAKPRDGNRSYKKYLEENLRYPQAARTNEIEGTVIIELTIGPSGEIDQVDIKKSLGYGCDQEAIRLVKEGPQWNAAEKNGINMEDKVRVRVKFKL